MNFDFFMILANGHKLHRQLHMAIARSASSTRLKLMRVTAARGSNRQMLSCIRQAKQSQMTLQEML